MTGENHVVVTDDNGQFSTSVYWNVKAEDIMLKNKGNQNASSPQNHAPQG